MVESGPEKSTAEVRFLPSPLWHSSSPAIFCFLYLAPLLIFTQIFFGLALFIFSSRLGARRASVLTLISTICSLIATAFLLKNCPLEIQVISGPYWFEIGSVPIYWSLEITALTAPMAALVTVITAAVLLYSCFYMSADPFLPRFLALLHCFAFFMLTMVFSGNLVQFFLGWEGIGLISFFLIGFWNHRPQALKSALKASIYNRIGDFFLFLFVVSLAWNAGTISFSSFLTTSNFAGSLDYFGITAYVSPINLVNLLLILAAFAKSAQFGFHGWLPDAMEGPTPVSALLHAATMVTAGVFLLLRCSYLLDSSPLAQLILTVFGLLTAALGTFSGFYQKDIKRVVAYSTTANLGFMVAACGLGLYGVAFFHLLSHGFFKAYLFLASGLAIHAFGGEQDLRGLNGRLLQFPMLFPITFLGSLLSVGFPFLCSFYSKDLIFFTSYGTISVASQIFFFFFSFLAFFGVFYSVRSNGFLAGTFLTPSSREFLPVVPASLGYLPVILLGIFSIFFGHGAFAIFSYVHVTYDFLFLSLLPSIGIWQEALPYFPFDDGLHSAVPIFSVFLGLGIFWVFNSTRFIGVARFGALLHFILFLNRFHLNSYISKFFTRHAQWFALRHYLVLFESTAMEYATVNFLSDKFYSVQDYYFRLFSLHGPMLFGFHYPFIFFLFLFLPIVFSLKLLPWIFMSLLVLVFAFPNRSETSFFFA